MAGIIPHVIVGLILAIVVHIIHFNWKYSLSILVGSLLPDILKFGLTAIKQATVNIFGISKDAFYNSLASITSSAQNWFALGFFVFVVMGYLYHYHYVKKKTMEDYDLLIVFLIIGVLVHLLMDVVFIEATPWF